MKYTFPSQNPSLNFAWTPSTTSGPLTWLRGSHMLFLFTALVRRLQGALKPGKEQGHDLLLRLKEPWPAGD